MDLAKLLLDIMSTSTTKLTLFHLIYFPPSSLGAASSLNSLNALLVAIMNNHQNRMKHKEVSERTSGKGYNHPHPLLS